MTTPDPLTEKLKDKIKFELKHSSAISLTPATEPDFDACLNEAIVQILQALESEGYVKTEQDVEVKDNVLRLNDLHLMTGQEFYDRFKAELKRQGAPTLDPRMAYPEEIEANVLEAARRAAGLGGVSDE